MRGLAIDGGRADCALPDVFDMTAPGDLNRRLVLEAPVESEDGAGGVTRLYDVVTTLWAKVVPLSASSELTAANLGARVRYRIIVRGPISRRAIAFRMTRALIAFLLRAKAPIAASSKSKPRNGKTEFQSPTVSDDKYAN